MSRRKSSILLPFNLNATKTVNQTDENATALRTTIKTPQFKTPANRRRRTVVEIVEPELDENDLEEFEGKHHIISRREETDN
jgi:hypothetical protein